MSYTKAQVARRATVATNVKPKGRPVPGQPLDPDELSRRLYVVLAEQNAYAEKKRRARELAERRVKHPLTSGHGQIVPPSAESYAWHSTSKKASTEPNIPDVSDKSRQADSTQARGVLNAHVRLGDSSSRREGEPADAARRQAHGAPGYQHTPSQAAKQFVKTTTVDHSRDTGLAHKLSRHALKLQLHSWEKWSAADTGVPSSEQETSLRKCCSHRDELPDRMQLAHASILEEGTRPREFSESNPHRHTFAGRPEIRKHPDNSHGEHARRSSTGAIVVKHSTTSRRPILVESPSEHVDGPSDEDTGDPSSLKDRRVDWTQSDEQSKHKSFKSPLLRRPDSIWTLKERLGHLARKKDKVKEEPAQGKGEQAAPPEPRSPKSGFFGRFKR